MKFNTSLSERLKPYFTKELAQYKVQYELGNFLNAWSHLERAHILGQQYPSAHTLVHWKMLLFGIKIKNRKEIVGQIPRLIFGGVKSFVGTIPIGNPGGANVPPLKSFPIEKELQLIFKTAGVSIRRE
ncbi:DUF3703 domain-containing protein [Ulvibacter litoralis]|uniref:DUF3703 domain-containing protein n=1 Tax=Ulvibacter litoralis TaxID=227084 RepID=A0A1G7IL87_9FLAO|nr:DUF3703 domain-containing protein [Ulvibacter litoralis]GHC61226.1 hypothetical protein GCM10008083_27930 [Ulvibacter litoralis]SDF13500.1 Protein of unknown function [Ulvibacter litoralis]